MVFVLLLQFIYMASVTLAYRELQRDVDHAAAALISTRANEVAVYSRWVDMMGPVLTRSPPARAFADQGLGSDASQVGSSNDDLFEWLSDVLVSHPNMQGIYFVNESLDEVTYSIQRGPSGTPTSGMYVDTEALMAALRQPGLGSAGVSSETELRYYSLELLQGLDEENSYTIPGRLTAMHLFDSQGRPAGQMVLQYCIIKWAKSIALRDPSNLLSSYLVDERNQFLGVDVVSDSARDFLHSQLQPESLMGWQEGGLMQAYRRNGEFVIAARVPLAEEGIISELSQVLIGKPEVIASYHAQLTRDNFIAGAVLLVVQSLFCIYLYQSIYRRNRLLQSNVEYERIVEHSLAGVMVVAADGEVLSCNEAGLAIFGFEDEQIVGDDLYRRVHCGDDVRLSFELLDELADSGHGNNEVTWTVAAQKLELLINVAWLDYEGHEGAFTLIIVDNSEQVALRHRMESANEKLEDEVRKRTIELEKAHELALTTNELKTGFIANISHELRTPIHGISGTLRLLRQDPLNERQNHRLMMAEESVAELSRIIGGIIDVSKLEADRLDLEESEISLPTVINKVVADIAPRAAKKGLELVVDIVDVSEGLIYGDGDRVGTVIESLLDNAVKFSEQGEIYVLGSTSLGYEDEVLFHLSVLDDGPGVTPSEVESLFDPYYRGQAAGDEGWKPGVGMGLAVGRQYCRLMGGELHVEAPESGGSRFTMELRLSALEPERVTSLVADGVLQQRRIVVMESGPNALSVMRRTLDAQRVQAHFCVDLMDLKLSQWESLDTLIVPLGVYEEYRSMIRDRLNRDKGIVPPLVLVTAYPLPEILMRQTSFDDNVFLLRKPVTPFTLENAILQAEGEQPPSHGDSRELGDDDSRKIWEVLPSLTVMVVDDNEINLRVVGGLLESYGTNVDYARQGQEAIDILLRNRGKVYDAIVMDCQMPVMDGYEATRRIRAGKAGIERRNVPVVAVTAGAMGADRAKCLESGMNDYLVKPLEPNALELSLVRCADGSDVSETSQVQSLAAKSEELKLAERNLRGLPDWSREDLERRILHNRDIFHTIVELYTRTSPDLVAQMDDTLEAANYRDLRTAAHDLKGMADNISASKVAYLARDIEMATLDRRIDDVSALLELLKRCNRRLVWLLEEETQAL
ncbi:hypothetical protein A3709_07780 [Halioglobus sp. HI00S01]|nr:hypothetical protein A3709_07780 [Halioglobus sp. HI00S01]